MIKERADPKRCPDVEAGEEGYEGYRREGSFKKNLFYHSELLLLDGLPVRYSPG